MATAAPTTANRDLLGRGSLYTIATAVQLGIGLLALPVLTRLLDPADFGLVATALVVTQIVRVLADLGLPTAITLDYFDHGPRRARQLAGVTICAAFLVALVVHLTGPLWVQVFANLDYSTPLAVAVWTAVPLSTLVAGQAVLRVEQRVGVFVTSAAVGAVCSQALGLGLVIGLDGGAEEYLIGVAVGYVLGALVAAGAARVGPLSARGVTHLGAALRLSWPSVPHGLARFLLQAGDRVVIERVDGLAAVGRYQVAYLVGSLGITVLAAMNNAWAPLVYGQEGDRRWSTVADTTRTVVRLAAIAAVGIAVTAPIALRIAMPSEYDPAGLQTVCAVIALSVLPYALYLAMVHVVFASRRTLVLAWVTPTSAALNIGVNLLVVPVWGLTGAAATTLATYVVQAGLVHRAARRLAHVPWDRAAMGAAAGLGVVGATAGALAPETGGWLVGRAVAGIVLLVLFVRSARRAMVSP